MSIRLGALVERLGGQLMGDANLEVTGIAPLNDAGVSHISFLSNSKLRAEALTSKAAALIVAAADDEFIAASYPGARIVVPNPYVYFAHAAQYFESLTAYVPPAGVHPTASVADGATVAASAHIGAKVVIEAGATIGEHAVIDAGCYIGRDAQVGEGTHFFANVTFHARCIIGKRGIIHSGAVIGTDGFGFANDKGVYIRIPQTGRVVMGDDVDIGANTTVDRGALADTVIEDGVKLDNLIQIAHNCHIGAHTAMAGCVGMAGSTTVGKYCTFGGAAMINGHINIPDHTHIGASTMISRTLTEPGHYTGYYPHAKHTDWEKSAAIVRNLPAIRDKVRTLEKTIKTKQDNES
jgi:UDP-3-O-[3-hydroxymyristoyl] glucosamine N-acyltransferase